MFRLSRFILCFVPRQAQRASNRFFRRVREARFPAQANIRIQVKHTDLRAIQGELERACQSMSSGRWDAYRVSSSKTVNTVESIAERAQQRRQKITDTALSKLAGCDAETARWLRVIYRKGPYNAYVRFVQEVRAQVKKKHPDKSFVERWKLIADMYRRLSVCDKDEYREKAKVLSDSHKLPFYH